MMKKLGIFLLVCITCGGAGCITVQKQNAIPPASTVVTTEVHPAQLVPLVEEYLNNKVTKLQKDNQVFSAFISYGYEIKNKQLYYYIWSKTEEYFMNKGILQRVSGFSGPALLVIDKQNNQFQKIIDYKTPEEGSGYSESAKKIFPRAILSKINIKGQELIKRNELLQNEVKSKVTSYFNLNLTDIVQKTAEEKCVDFSFEKYKLGPDQIQATKVAEWDSTFNSSTVPNYDLRAKIAPGYFSGSVNFAGHFIVSSWSCGKKCQEHAVVDAQTGRIVKTGLHSVYGVEFKLNSLVFVVNPYSAILAPDPQKLVTSYYVVDESQSIPELKLVCEYDHSGQAAPKTDVEPEI